MSFLYRKPADFVPGHNVWEGPLSADVLNQIVRALLREIRGGQETKVGYYGDRLTIESLHEQGYLPQLANYVAFFAVISEDYDTLQCAPFQQPLDPTGEVWTYQPYSPSTGTTPSPNDQLTFEVAKPYQLQQTPWNGKKVTLNGTTVSLNYTGIGTRTATGTTGVTENQVIVPDYMSGDVILAVRLPGGYIDQSSGFPIGWMDLNNGARAWAVRAPGT